jgi:hypothetical protein
MAKIAIFVGNNENNAYTLAIPHVDYLKNQGINASNVTFIDDRTNPALIACIEAVRAMSDKVLEEAYNFNADIDQNRDAERETRRVPYKKLECLIGVPIKNNWNYGWGFLHSGVEYFCLEHGIQVTPDIQQAYHDTAQIMKHAERWNDIWLHYRRSHAVEYDRHYDLVFNDGFEIVEYDETIWTPEIERVGDTERVVFSRTINQATVEQLAKAQDVDTLMDYIRTLTRPVEHFPQPHVLK